MQVVSKLHRRQWLGVAEKLRDGYWLFKTRFYYRPQFAEVGRNSVIIKPMLIRNPKGISIGANSRIRDGARIEVVDRPGCDPGRLVIGENVRIEQSVHIVCCDTITIGDNVTITPGCVIVDTSHPEFTRGAHRAEVVDGKPSHVIIGDNVFLGARTIVLPNVTIGHNSVIGAGSIVSRDVPANSVASGSPARTSRQIGT